LVWVLPSEVEVTIVVMASHVSTSHSASGRMVMVLVHLLK